MTDEASPVAKRKGRSPAEEEAIGKKNFSNGFWQKKSEYKPTDFVCEDGYCYPKGITLTELLANEDKYQTFEFREGLNNAVSMCQKRN